MNQRYKELIEFVRTVIVPYSKTSKARLVEQIQDLKKLAREDVKGYSQLEKGELVKSILYHRRVVKPRIND